MCHSPLGGAPVIQAEADAGHALFWPPSGHFLTVIMPKLRSRATDVPVNALEPAPRVHKYFAVKLHYGEFEHKIETVNITGQKKHENENES